MTGDLLLSIGSDTTRQLGCVDLASGPAWAQFSIPLGSSGNRVAAIDGQSVKFDTTHGLLVRNSGASICQLGDPNQQQLIMYQRIAMNGNQIKYLPTPADSGDAATKGYVDEKDARVFTIARVGAGAQDHQTVDLGASGPHVAIGAIFQYAYGVSAAAWNSATGLFTAPAGGAYAVTANLRIQAPAGVGSLANVYTSINGSTTYGTDTNIVYRVYGRTNNLSLWHSFEVTGLVTLNQGDTLGLNCSYGTGVWTFHTTASMQIGRISI